MFPVLIEKEREVGESVDGMQEDEKEFYGEFELIEEKGMQGVVASDWEQDEYLGLLLPDNGNQAQGDYRNEDGFLVDVPAEEKGGQSADDQAAYEMEGIAGATPQFQQTRQHGKYCQEEGYPGCDVR